MIKRRIFLRGIAAVPAALPFLRWPTPFPRPTARTPGGPVTVFRAGTYTKPAGLKQVRVWMIGAGDGGSGKTTNGGGYF